MESPKTSTIFHIVVIIIALIILYYVYQTHKYLTQAGSAIAGQFNRPNNIMNRLR